MRLYKRNYLDKPNKEEINMYNIILSKERKHNNFPFGRINYYLEYPEAIRHYKSLFPNNHIELNDWKKTNSMPSLIQEFNELIHNIDTNEQDILRFINHKPAYFIIASLFSYTRFGHHESYIMPEFSIENGKYRADYLLIGKNSGGYEFLFVELESPNGYTTIKSGHEGYNQRSGLNQIRDWKCGIAADFLSITKELEKYTNKELPIEFKKYDDTRFHYAVVTGLREDYNDVTYTDRRRTAKEQGIELYHYDNLYDLSISLFDKTTF